MHATKRGLAEAVLKVNGVLRVDVQDIDDVNPHVNDHEFVVTTSLKKLAPGDVLVTVWGGHIVDVSAALAENKVLGARVFLAHLSPLMLI